MAKTIIARSSIGVITNSATLYHRPFGAGVGPSSSELSDHKISIRSAGTISNLAVYVSSNSRNGASTFITRKNGADGNNSVSITASTTGAFVDTTHTDTISAGDLFNYKSTRGGSSGSTTVATVSCLFEASSNTVSIIASASFAHTVASATRYFDLAGGDGNSAASTESDAQSKFSAAVTAKNLSINVSLNLRTNTTTFRTRLNGGNGNITVSVTSGSSGLFEDTSNTDSIANDDLYCIGITTGSGTQLIQFNPKIEFESTANQFHLINSSTVVNGLSLSTTVNYHSIFGAYNTRSTTENDMKVVCREAYTLSKLKVAFSGASSSTKTIRLRINGNNGNSVISTTSTTTGWFEDASNTDSVSVGDLLDFSSVTSSGGALRGITILATAGASSVDITVTHAVQSATFSLPSLTVTAVKNVSIAAAVLGLVASLIAPSVVAVKNVSVSPAVQCVFR